MRRVAWAVVIAFLALGASGIAELCAGDPCSASEATGQARGCCAPTCVTCGCCTQAAEPTAIVVAVIETEAAPTDPIPATRVLETDPREVLHVPKALAA